MAIETTTATPAGNEGEQPIVKTDVVTNVGTDGKNTPPETVPYSALSKKVERIHELEEKLAAVEAEKKAEQEKKMKSEGKIKELYEEKLAELETQKIAFAQEKFNTAKEGIISKYNLPENLKKYVIGNTLEEVDASAKELSETVIQKKEEPTVDENKNKIPVKPEGVKPQMIGKGSNNIFNALKNAPELK